MGNLENGRMTEALKVLILSFANFHALDGDSNHDLRLAQRKLKNVGKILSQLSYFDYDAVEGEQKSIVERYQIRDEWISGV